MADLKISNLNKKTGKYLFKNKFSSKKTTKKKLIFESFFMLIISFLLAYLNYLIPNKSLLFKNFIGTFEKSFLLLIDLFGYIFQLLLVIVIVISLMLSLILFIGSFSRFIKVLSKNSKYF